MNARTAVLLVIAAAFLFGCSTTRSDVPAMSPNAGDPVPAKIASQRAATAPSLNLEAEDERWGIEAARARRATPHATTASIAFPLPTDPSAPDGGIPDGHAPDGISAL
jgi:hypothetical protein